MNNSAKTRLRQEAMAQFEQLVELDTDARAAELDRLAQHDAALYAQVRRLLEAHHAAEADGFLAGDAAQRLRSLGAAADETADTLHTGAAFGAYRLERPLGRGGMGEVWLASRVDGLYDGQVAIKTLHAHLAQPGTRERFAREGRILGRLQHPNIARLLDAGTTDDGRLYLVLEYVAGEHLIAWCDARQLGIAARLRLFLPICDAVAHAHAQLVVHRDLKPSNILVTASGEPKLLDFGIAKLIEGDASADTTPGAQTELTRLGGRALTPEYAAPEQMLGEPVSTATDVYALGVLLYELLCGMRPHGDAGTTAPQFERAVIETDARPLTQSALRRSDGERASPEERAQRRGLHPLTLRKALRGDLDNILRKALRREPLQRYASVSAFADDLRRHLAHEPVSARPDAFSYRAGKFLRRYRSGVVVATVVLVALSAGLGLALWQAQIARAQAQRAELQQHFLLSLFEEQDPLSRARAQARSPAQLIAAGVELVRRETGDDPALTAALLDSLGTVQISVDQPQTALATLEEALRLQRARLSANDLAIASTLDHIATAHLAAGRLRDARAPLDEALAIYRRQLAPKDLRIAASEARLGRAILTSQPQDALALIQNAHARHAAQLGGNHPETLARQLELGTAYGEADRLDLAEATYRDLIERQRRRLGADHLALAFPLTSLADLQRRLNRFADAQASYEQALRIGEAQLGAQHPMVAKIRMRQGNLLRLMGRLDEAAAALIQAETGLSERDGGNLAQLYQLQGHVLREQGRYAEAEARYRRSFERFRAVLGDDDRYTWNAALAVGEAQIARGALKQAEATLREAVQHLQALSPPDGYDAAVSSALLASAYRLQRAYADALPLDRRALAAFRKIYGEWHTSTLEVQTALATDLLGLRDAPGLTEARALLDAALARPEAREDAVLQGTLLIVSAAAAQRQQDDARARRERVQGRTLLDGAGARGARVVTELRPFLNEPAAAAVAGT